MKISCIQMDMKFACPEENFLRACVLIEKAAEGSPDVIVLPETWNTGFFPTENLAQLCDEDCRQVNTVIGGLAKKYHVNIVSGSVSNLRCNRIYNTSLVFDREGSCVAVYDKTHLFSPMGEDSVYTPGDHLCRFTLDGVRCGIIVCYDLRFPELTRTLALPGLDMLFVVSQWPESRISHLRTLTAARAIENQLFVVCCNSCGTAGKTVFGGNSAILDPLGNILAAAGSREELLSANCSLDMLPALRESIPVFQDRKPRLYYL